MSLVLGTTANTNVYQSTHFHCCCLSQCWQIRDLGARKARNSYANTCHPKFAACTWLYVTLTLSPPNSRSAWSAMCSLVKEALGRVLILPPPVELVDRWRASPVPPSANMPLEVRVVPALLLLPLSELLSLRRRVGLTRGLARLSPHLLSAPKEGPE